MNENTMTQDDIESAINNLHIKHKPDGITLIYCWEQKKWEITIWWEAWGDTRHRVDGLIIIDDDYTYESDNLRNLFYNAMKLTNNQS